MTENQKGERVFVDTWEIYRLHFGMEEWEYYIFHNEEYFADAPTLTRAQCIIQLYQKAGVSER